MKRLNFEGSFKASILKKLSLISIVWLVGLTTISQLNAQRQISSTQMNSRPKLVVGIVVDQMRYDYLTRFYDKYSEGGFKRMINEGFNCKNNHFNYVPTSTGPGHASVYTGTTPKYHGIISNNWYDKKSKNEVYCVNDDSFDPVGTTDNYSRVSPNRMTVTTVSDELKLFTQHRAKVIGIAIKDRGAALPAGHAADAAYWFQGKDEGNWVTSSYYMNTLPSWVKDFNASKKADAYLTEWKTLYDIDTYFESGPDLNDFELGFNGKDTPTFPYDLANLRGSNRNYELIKSTPYGNSLTIDFAIAAIDGEDLGQDDVTDLLAISFSSTDYIGHNFGVNAKETQDTYLRLDLDLQRFLNALDDKVGKGNYTVFLTSDHGVVHVPAYLQSHNIAAGYYDLKEFRRRLNAFMKATYNADDLVEFAGNYQIFLNREKLLEMGLKLSEVQNAIVEEIINYDFIDKAYSAHTMATTAFNHGMEKLLQQGYHQKRSGDVLVILSPAVISRGRKGTTHGSGYAYDTHVPLLLYGHGINRGSTFERTEIPDIAPTISALLGIAFPNATIGRPISKAID